MSPFISFEGGEGSGKSSQAEILRQRLQQAGVSSLLVREPGTTALGDYLKAWLKREQRRKTSSSAEALLFAAARAELVSKTIKPALASPRTVVIADRYADSTTAYQGYGRRLRLKDVDAVNCLATQGIMPDLTFLLDCSPEVGLRRVGSFHDTGRSDTPETVGPVRMDREGTRRFESESLAFHKRVRAGYLKISKREPDRWCLIDATKSVDEISDIVWARVEVVMAQDMGADSSEPNPSFPLWA